MKKYNSGVCSTSDISVFKWNIEIMSSMNIYLLLLYKAKEVLSIQETHKPPKKDFIYESFSISQSFNLLVSITGS